MAGTSTTVTGAVWTVGFVSAVRTYFDTVTFSCTSSVIAGGCEVVILTVGFIRVIFKELSWGLNINQVKLPLSKIVDYSDKMKKKITRKHNKVPIREFILLST